MNSLKIHQSVYDEIMNTVGELPPEKGGILLGNREEFTVEKFIYDSLGNTSYSSYDPDIESLNELLTKEFENDGLSFMGFVHSHPRGVSHLSGDWGNGIGDLGYIKEIFDSMPDLQSFISPIVFSSSDGGEKNFIPYVVRRELFPEYEEVSYEVISNQITNDFKLPFSKLHGSVDSQIMEKSHVVCVGIGGASGICEGLVRSGVGILTLIDFDTVDATNVITQGYYIDEIGLPKVEALASRLMRINPHLKLRLVEGNSLNLTEKEKDIIFSDASLALWMTDDFHAQADGNVISLKYNMPSIFAMMYEKGLGAEITFHIPGITQTCYRCCTESRFKAYQSGYENDVTSDGATNFNVSFLNSSIGLLALAILNNNIQSIEFGEWFNTGCDRNLIQIRTSPKWQRKEFEENIDMSIAFDSIWYGTNKKNGNHIQKCQACNK